MAGFNKDFFGKLREALQSRRIKLNVRRRANNIPKGKIVRQRDEDKKVAFGHKYYGNGAEHQLLAMEEAKKKLIAEGIAREMSERNAKGRRRRRRNEFPTDYCRNVF